MLARIIHQLLLLLLALAAVFATPPATEVVAQAAPAATAFSDVRPERIVFAHLNLGRHAFGASLALIARTIVDPAPEVVHATVHGTQLVW